LALDEEIYRQRRDKLAHIEALGQRTYPTEYRFTHTIPQILAEYSPKSGEELAAQLTDVRIAGRIMAIRVMGKAAFAHLQQGGGRLQIYVKKDEVGEKGWELFKLLDLGDHIGAAGYLFRTRTNELSIHVKELTFLSKDLLPLPEKWHGLTDLETRYRQRYVDLIVNPESRDVFVKRSKVIQSIRRFMEARGFIEVETPMMHSIVGGAAARPFITHHNTLDLDLYLRIAPELYLKRLIVGGLDRVYEINRNFRNEGISIRHNPEFTMLEFYQAYANYHDLMDLSQEMLQQAALDVNGTTKTTYDGNEIDFADFQRLTMREAITKFWPDAAGAKPEMRDFETLESVEALIRRHNAAHSPHVPFDSKDPKGKSIATLFETLSEEHLIQPTIIHEFPTDVSPLSKKKFDEPEWTERFEIYCAGMEIANAFSELNDPEDQLARFQGQVKERERGDEEAMAEVDYDYVRALSYGMPPTAGEGVGIDRLTMILTGSRSIRDVILFPLMRPEKQEESQEASAGIEQKAPASQH
jgi:lysyl-tRNA synthetase, class II